MRHCNNPACPALSRDGLLAEYIDEVVSCQECGEPLVEGEAPPAETIEYRPLVTVYQAPDGVVAHLVRGAIEARGIPVHLAGAQLAGAVGELPATVLQIQVRVPPEYAERARAIALEAAGSGAE